MVATANFSTLLRDPNGVIQQLRDSGEVLITRRDGEDLRLSLADSAAQESTALSALAQLIAASLEDDVSDRLADHLAAPFPWIEFLPPAHRRNFVGDFLRTARACAAVGRFERLAILIAAWRGTAEIYADPAASPDGADLQYLTTDNISPAPDPRS